MAKPLVSVRELKSRLSHYLRLTRKGESVVITDRGVPIGRIVPMGHVPIGPDLDQRIAAQVEELIGCVVPRKLRRPFLAERERELAAL